MIDKYNADLLVSFTNRMRAEGVTQFKFSYNYANQPMELTVVMDPKEPEVKATITGKQRAALIADPNTPPALKEELERMVLEDEKGDLFSAT
jgi:hypothetical protein